MSYRLLVLRAPNFDVLTIQVYSKVIKSFAFPSHLILLFWLEVASFSAFLDSSLTSCLLVANGLKLTEPLGHCLKARNSTLYQTVLGLNRLEEPNQRNAHFVQSYVFLL